MIKQARLALTSFGCLVACLLVILSPTVSDATKYGAGSYGRCQYQSCSLTLTSSGTVNVNVTPNSAGARCSVAKDTVTVTTSSSTGYTLTLKDSDTSNALTYASSTVPATTGTYASPTTLASNRWGYRVDGQGTFGAGPTSALSNVATPSATFAAVPISSGTADTITTSTTAATSGATTSVWYGLCITPTTQSGTYTDSVTYTALTN